MKQLQEIQSELKAPKNQYNKFGGYKYRNAEDIMEAVKPLLKKHGCTLTVSDDIVLVGNRFYIKATATITDNEGTTSVSTTAFAREEETKKGMDAAQITGAASSYARKYALNGLFCIDDTKDADATNNGEQAKGVDETLALALQELKAAQSRDTLNGIYANYKSILGRNQRFLDEMNARAAELGITPKK